MVHTSFDIATIYTETKDNQPMPYGIYMLYITSLMKIEPKLNILHICIVLLKENNLCYLHSCKILIQIEALLNVT